MRAAIFTLIACIVSALGDDQLDRLKKELYLIARQAMLQQFNAEERVRSEGNSGIKQIRVRSTGLKNYHAESHSGHSVAGIHDHSNNIRTVGMGEFIGVLNGVEFRTRHNDYRLEMPHRRSKEFHATEQIPFPDVPPEVTGKSTVDEQIAEMREWFRAWKSGDPSIRDYRKYFKPVLCYLEGAWIKPEEKIEDTFQGDNYLDASNWIDLQQKIRFTSYAGSKSLLENLAHLPTKIIRFQEHDEPVFARWNYRTLCQPLKDDVPLHKFRPVDDLPSRLSVLRSRESHIQSAAARFQLDLDLDPARVRTANVEATIEQRTFLDSLMEQIPGKDNGPANVQDTAYGSIAMDVDGKNPKNTGYYHRYYRVGGAVNKRGFSDDQLFMAQTTNETVVGQYIEVCSPEKVCTKLLQRWTYAIPLEIIYLTPLSNWNPHNIPFNDDSQAVVTGDGTKENPFSETTSKRFFRTPHAFFAGSGDEIDQVDSHQTGYYFLSETGEAVTVRASGTRILFPPIEGIDSRIRQRYPIMPIHGEGSAVWKKLNAIEDLLVNTVELHQMSWGSEGNVNRSAGDVLIYETSTSRSSEVTRHTHSVLITQDQLTMMKPGERISVTTTEAVGHQHTLLVGLRGIELEHLRIFLCDERSSCFDRHDNTLYRG